MREHDSDKGGQRLQNYVDVTFELPYVGEQGSDRRVARFDNNGALGDRIMRSSKRRRQGGTRIAREDEKKVKEYNCRNFGKFDMLLSEEGPPTSFKIA